MFKKDGKRDTS